ncbi:hypothetical protein AB0O76_22715 [Streptomyces sp. NPDC086554]|uniref:hypothetical protein n=1 Tax=Streptomyces sp. NPDC086554 TaxID=3154864 RepID=UPI00342A83F8
MATALLTVIAGLAGLVIGRFWDSRSESARWRRDLRVRSYEDVAKEFYHHRALIQRCSALSVDSSEKEEAVRVLSDHHAVWNQQLTALWIHGSEPAAATAYSLDHEMSALRRIAIREQIPFSSWHLRREPVQQAFDDFLDAVRADLSLPALQVLRRNAPDRIS